MIYEGIDIWNSPSLEHHGVKGMKWGVRHDKIREFGSKAKKTFSNIKTGAQRKLYNRGKKLDKGFYNPNFGSISGFTASGIYSKMATGLAYAAKSRYMNEKMSGIYKKPSVLTVGMAAASLEFTGLASYTAASTIYNNVAYNYYKKHKGDFK